MFQDFFRESSLLAFPLAGLILFVGSFLAVLAHTTWGLGRRGADQLASLPLDEDEARTSSPSDRE